MGQFYEKSREGVGKAQGGGGAQIAEGEEGNLTASSVEGDLEEMMELGARRELAEQEEELEKLLVLRERGRKAQREVVRAAWIPYWAVWGMIPGQERLDE
jgi:hypothetical protein